MIDDELMRVWTRDNPAPDLVVHMVLCSRIHSGEPWGKSKLSKWSGLTDYKARQAIKRAEQWMEAWNSEINRHATHLNDYQSSTIPDTYEDESTGKIRKNPKINRSRARSLSTGTETDTPNMIDVETSDDINPIQAGNQGSSERVLSQGSTDGQAPPDGNRGPSPQKGATPKKKDGKERGKNIGNEDTIPLWEALNEKRRDVRRGAQALKLTPGINRALNEALRYATPEQILNAYDWFNHAKGARWWQDRECDLHVFARQKHLEDFINSSVGWSLEIERQQEETDDLPF
tara:strand:- start:285 stop:1151 length:867 start_codon:yes stop_codon:yes gene_type:complete